MGRSYAQLSLEDRCTVARLQADGRSIRQIAATVDRAPSTISRELKRNGGRQVGYRPGYAEEQTRARRWSGSRLEREPELRRTVLDRLARGWSPEQVAGRLAVEAGEPVISHESIYRFIYAQLARTKDYGWRLYLPRAKSKRGLRGRRGGSPASFIDGRIPIAERPPAASDRNNPGHWEADLMLFAKYGQAVLTVHERHSRIILATRPPNKTADLIAEQLVAIFADSVFEVGGKGMGILMSLSGAGAVAGSLIIASLPGKKRGLIMLCGTLALGLVLTAFSFSEVWVFSMSLMVFVGLAQTAQMTMSNTLVQHHTPNEYRGRVMGVYDMQMSLVGPATLIAGVLTQRFGVQTAFGTFSIILTAIALLALLFVPRLRRLD